MTFTPHFTPQTAIKVCSAHRFALSDFIKNTKKSSKIRQIVIHFKRVDRGHDGHGHFGQNRFWLSKSLS